MNSLNSFNKFEPFKSHAPAKSKCSHEFDLEKNDSNKFYFCECSVKKLFLICESCINNCHKDHRQIMQVSSEYCSAAYFKGELKCDCGINSHKIEVDSISELNPLNKCIFENLSYDSKLKTHGEYKLCIFCSEECQKNGKYKQEGDSCCCMLHRNVDNIKLLHYCFVSNTKKIKSPMITFSNLMRVDFIREKILETFKSILKKYVKIRVPEMQDEEAAPLKSKYNPSKVYSTNYENIKEPLENFYKEKDIIEILEIFDMFITKGKNKYFYINNLFEDMNLEDIMKLLEIEFKMEDKKIKNKKIKNENFYKIKIHFYNLLFLSNIKLFYLNNNILMNNKNFLQMNYYQRKLYYYDSKNFYKYNNFSNKKLVDPENFTKFSEIAFKIFSELKNNLIKFPCLLSKINKTIKFYFKYNLVDDIIKEKYFDDFKKIILSIEKIVDEYKKEKNFEEEVKIIEENKKEENFNESQIKSKEKNDLNSDISNFCFNTIKSILYYMYYLNDVILFENRTNKNNPDLKLAFESSPISKSLAYCFILSFRKYKKNNKKFIFFSKNILNIFLGNNYYYLITLENIKNCSFMTPDTPDVSKLLQFRNRCSSNLKFKALNNEINEFAFYLAKFNKEYFNFKIEYETYISNVNFLIKKSNSTLKNLIILPNFNYSDFQLGKGISIDDWEKINIFQYFIKFSNLTEKLNEMIFIVQKRKNFLIKLNEIPNKSCGDSLKLSNASIKDITPENKRYLLSILYLNFQRNPENIIYITSFESKKFAKFFFDVEDKSYFFLFLEFLSEYMFNEIKNESYIFNNFIFIYKFLKKLVSTVYVDSESKDYITVNLIFI